MSAAETSLPRVNPFSSSRVRPGAIAFLFSGSETAEAVVERLRAGRWRGQIVGPHGSGKSTLLAALLPVIERTGRSAVLVTLHDRQRRLPVDLARSELAERTVVLVDGYEQLSPWSRFQLLRVCRRRGFGLLVTAHAPMGFPLLYRTDASPAIARWIVADLLGAEAGRISAADIDAAFERRRGNLRETLFDLYDLYELRRQGG